MPNNALNELDVVELQKLIHRREISASDLVHSCLDKIDKTQKSTNAFVAFDAERALELAHVLDSQAANGQFAGPLHGIPVAVKDNYWTADFPTTACSRVHQGKPTGMDAVAVARLRDAGAIIIGKTNMHEWAYGATNEVSSFGTTCNPWNSDHITGGSSGGSGAALAARMVPAALGSDTGGSVRIPAAGCGVCGLKPTFGRVSRFGIFPLSWSFDVAGPMARSAHDLDLLFRVISGMYQKDLVSCDANKLSQRGQLGDHVRIAVLRSNELPCDDAIVAAVDVALATLVDNGAVIKDVEILGLKTGFGAWKIILHSEAATYHAQFLSECPEKYSDSVRSQIEAGRCLSAPSYLRAQQYRTLFNQRLGELFEHFDMVAMPTIPVTAPCIGQKEININGNIISSQDAMTSIAWIANFSGLPAVSIPCGLYQGLPIGLTLVGSAYGEKDILNIAGQYQKNTQWHRMKPV